MCMNGTVLMGNTNITQSITVNSDQVYAAGYYTDNGNTVFGPGGFMNISGCVQLNGVLIVSPALALRTSHFARANVATGVIRHAIRRADREWKRMHQRPVLSSDDDRHVHGRISKLHD